jgi:hypothetical protein
VDHPQDDQPGRALLALVEIRATRLRGSQSTPPEQWSPWPCAWFVPDPLDRLRGALERKMSATTCSSWALRLYATL